MRRVLQISLLWWNPTNEQQTLPAIHGNMIDLVGPKFKKRDRGRLNTNEARDKGAFNVCDANSNQPAKKIKPTKVHCRKSPKVKLKKLTTADYEQYKEEP